MKRVAILLAFHGAMLAGCTLFPDHVTLVLTLAGVLGFGTMIWGVVSLRSGILCSARWRERGTTRRVALTFDDGPDPASTPALLGLLEERGVEAAFFCVGEKVRTFPEIVRRCHGAGHLVANHSDRHSVWTNFYFAGRLRRELESCSLAIEQATGETPRYYRPPFGLANHALRRVTRILALEVVGWQVRGLDTPGSDPETVAARILARVRPGGVVLLHDGGRDPAKVVAATRAVLDGLEALKLEPVRLDRLLEE